MASLDEAVRAPHFVARALFAQQATGPAGTVIAALPVPIAPDFRDKSRPKGRSVPRM